MDLGASLDGLEKRGISGFCRQSNRDFLNTLTPELNPSAQRCLTKFFTGDFGS
jgi:hypothetical protein